MSSGCLVHLKENNWSLVKIWTKFKKLLSIYYFWTVFRP